MHHTLFLLSGIIILLITLYDFFYTTLSGSGASFLTKTVGTVSHKFILGLYKLFGRRVFSIGGLFLNGVMIVVWLLLIWTGVLLIFSYDPGGVVNSDGRVATFTERLYFTGYTISTLGLGNFKPVTPLFEIVTALSSIIGFIFFTTSMTYFISLSSSLANKRSLALTIRNMGSTPAEMVKTLHSMDASLLYQQLSAIQQLLNRHTVNHKAFPMIHYFNEYEDSSSFGINFVSLDEALTILLFSKSQSSSKSGVSSLRNSINDFLHEVRKKYTGSDNENLIPGISLQNLDLHFEINEQQYQDSNEVLDRRKVLSRLLKSEGFNWKNIYPEKALS